MVSSDFGKLDVMRHLISGEDCAIAGEATAVAAAPAAETFKKSRRFIKASPCWGVSPIDWPLPATRFFHVDRRRFGSAVVQKLWRTSDSGHWRGLNTEVRPRKRDKGMTALNESRMPLKRLRSRP